MGTEVVVTHSKEGKDVRGSLVHTQVPHSLLRDVGGGGAHPVPMYVQLN